jgi:arsenical pump membrane protein
VRLLRRALFTAGVIASVAAVLADGGGARAAAAQDWSPFVLVAGLLLIGLAAEREGVFAAAGAALSHRFSNDKALTLAFVVLVGVVSATLNLDTSVAFLTPVCIYTGRRRPAVAAALLYGTLLLSNAGSLLLPGSNLTNLIVLGGLRLSGLSFLSRMALPWLLALLVTGLVVARLRPGRRDEGVVDTRQGTGVPRPGPGLVAVGLAVVLVLALHQAAPEVAAVGALVTLWALVRGGQKWPEVTDVLDAPVLLGLLGVAVGIGTLGRDWSWPARELGHLDSWGAAGAAAVVSLLVNNLPAASLLGARPPVHPYAVLVGLDLGPNLFLSGSLAWFIWLRSARRSGAQPSLARAVRCGLVAAPLSMAAALLALQLTRR